MRQIRISKRKPGPTRLVDRLELSLRDPDIVRAKQTHRQPYDRHSRRQPTAP